MWYIDIIIKKEKKNKNEKKEDIANFSYIHKILYKRIL